MFAPVTNALDTLLTYVAVQGYLALLRYIHWVWRRKHTDDTAKNIPSTYLLAVVKNTNLLLYLD